MKGTTVFKSKEVLKAEQRRLQTVSSYVPKLLIRRIMHNPEASKSHHNIQYINFYPSFSSRNRKNSSLRRIC
jgi:hypothetical protein